MKKNQSIKENQRKIVFENHRKSLIQHCERSELRLLKFIKNAKNGQFLRETCGQTVLPDRSISIGQKLVDNAMSKKENC